jgi:hypothetical protein
MKTDFKILGFAFWVSLVPMAAMAQVPGQNAPGTDGSLTSPDDSAPAINANPFTSAGGADKFYQDNSLTGSTQSNSGDETGNNDSVSSSAPAGTPDVTPAAPDDSSTALTANPFVGAAGADKYYQDNSLTGASPPNTSGALGGTLGDAGTWATTP